MEIHLTGTEVHALREALESVLDGVGREIAGLKDPERLHELATKKDALRSIKDKLPAALTEVS